MSECAKGVSVGSQNLPKSANERFKKSCVSSGTLL